MPVLSRSLIASLFLCFLLFAATTSSRTTRAAPAAPIVDTLLDEYDGSCADGDCSLRDAIAEAADGDIITFNVTGTIVLSRELRIRKDLPIDGGGVITVSGNDATRVFNVTNGNVAFSNLTIANGKSESCDDLASTCGGGIALQPPLGNSGVAVTVTNSTLSGNSADFGGGIYTGWRTTVSVTNSTLSDNRVGTSGGGIANSNGTVTVTNSTLSGNSANSFGGGILNVGALTVTNSTFSGNKADTGGGIRNSDGTATVTNSTFSGNSADVRGGGIYNDDATVTVSNSTLSGNSAIYSGGGIYNSGTAMVTNSTLSGNSTKYGDGGGVASYGYNLYKITLTTLGSSIVSGNIKSYGTTADDLALHEGSTNSFSSGGYNLIGAIGAGITFAGPDDQIGVNDPQIGPLGDNGGDTLTHALLIGSPAYDAGGNCGVATDQRGFARPQGSACDIGAFEVQFPTLTVSLAGTRDGSVSSLPVGINCFDGAGSDCTEIYREGTAVTLTATAVGDSTFSGWSGGGCSGTAACVVTLNGAKTITASFAPPTTYTFLPVVLK